MIHVCTCVTNTACQNQVNSSRYNESITVGLCNMARRGTIYVFLARVLPKPCKSIKSGRTMKGGSKTRGLPAVPQKKNIECSVGRKSTCIKTGKFWCRGMEGPCGCEKKC